MVEIKVDTDEILFRIVFAGRDRATKFATLRTLHGAFADAGDRPMIVMHAGGDRVVGFDLPVAETEKLFGMAVRIEALARPGERRSPANDVLLHRSADAVIWLDDRDGDPDGLAPIAFENFLGDLERIGRKPEDLPIFVQCYGDAPDGDRRALYKSRRRSWRPDLRIIGVGNDERDVFIAARDAVFGAYRRYEKDLSRAGLQGHVKIRDRVYERLVSQPGNETPREMQEVRLLRSQRPRRSRGLRSGAIVALFGLAAVAAAAYLATKVL